MASMSKEEYLKRYLSGPAEETKKKKKKTKVKSKTSIRVVDDDVDWRTIAPDVNEEPEALDIEEEKPSVAGVIDERPAEEVQLEAFRKSDRWRLMGKDGGKNKSNRESFQSVDSPSQSSRRRHDSDSDQSPPRRKKQGSDDDLSPPRPKYREKLSQGRKRHDSESDQSPPRRQRNRSDSDQSPPRKGRQHSDSDQSPPRRKRHDSDQSPPKRRKPHSDSDQSPPRRKRHDSDQSPPRKRGRDHGTERSPKRRRHDSNDDLSPPRRRADSDEEAPRRHQRHDSDDSDLSPPRQARSNSDQSPPRQKPTDERRKDKHNRKSDQLEMGTGLSGKKAGLQDAQSLREEAKMIKAKEKAMFDRMNDEVSGKNAETVYREKGRKRDMKAEKLKQREEEIKAREEQEKYMQWGRGVAQTKEQEENIADHLREMDKPLARYRDDEDLEQLLRNQEREGDPMLAFLSKKKSKGKDGKEKPRYNGPAPPPNRFNIWPGYRWDGVDRSNGFEKRFFQAQANRKTVKDEAYKWSVEDM